MIESVDGMMNAAAGAHERPAGDQLPHRRSTATRAAAATRNVDEPELERALAAEPVADRAGREEQAREHERVGRRRPTGAATRSRPRSRDERRDRDVQARVADEDDEQAQAEDAEHPPAAVVSGVVQGRRHRRDLTSRAGSRRFGGRARHPEIVVRICQKPQYDRSHIPPSARK